MIILLKIPTAANVIELAKFQSRDGCFNAGNIQFISYIISLQQTDYFQHRNIATKDYFSFLLLCTWWTS